jgi:hypothetical protein
MLSHFLRAWADSRKLFNVLRDIEASSDPTGAKAPRRLQDLPAESECLERKSTDKFNTANFKKRGMDDERI